MSDIPVTGLMNIGNICFLNSMMQCFYSLKSIQSFLEAQVDGDASPEHRFVQMVQEELKRMKTGEGRSICLKQELLEYVYFQIFWAKFNSQQDITELLMRFFDHLQLVAPEIYLENFGFFATYDCSRPNESLWSLQFSVTLDENIIDIGEKLSNAVFLRPDEVCKCGQKRVHIYGDVPKCLIIIAYKVTDFNVAYGTSFVRQDVQIKCQPIHRINGQEYEMKAASKYIGKNGKGGGIGKSLRKLWCIPKKSKSYKKLEEDEIPREYRRADEQSSPPKSGAVFVGEISPVQNSRPKVKFCSFPRKLPLMSNQSGHYTSYVKRGDDFYYISDADVAPTSVVKTDDLVVLFYERK